MGDSDDEYDRKRRDKFRGERAEASYRGPERVARPRDDWAERDSWSRPRPREYRPRDRGYSPSMEPQQKRMRHDFYGENYGYNHYNTPYQPPHRGLFYREPLGGMPGGPAAAGEGQQPPMMSFKAFLATQDDNISDSEAIEKYNDYKLEFQRQQLNEFFVAHKDEEWFRLKYHPEDSVKRREEQAAALKKRVEVFIDLLNSGKLGATTVDCARTNDLLKLMDTVVIKLEGGTDEDLALLEQEYLEMEQKYREQKEKESLAEKAREARQLEVASKKEEGELDSSETSKPKNEEEETVKTTNGEAEDQGKKEEDGEIEMEEVKSPEKKEEAEEEEEEKKKDDDETMEVVDKEKKEEEETEATEEKPQEIAETEPKPEKSPVAEKQEKKKPDKKRKRSRSYSGSSSNSSSSNSSSSDSENDEEEENDKKKADEEKQEEEDAKKTTDKGSENSEKVDGKEKEKDGKEKETEVIIETIIDDGKPEKPKALHKTTSIFLRSLAPTITKQEVEAMCSRYDGFLRVALADPQPERRWLRRGWVTFKRESNIKEICWNLNNIRLRECELGAIVNRDLSRRIRPVNGITAHKQVVRSDIRIAAKVTLHLDSKTSLWPDDEDKKERPQQTFGLVSNNPVLHNITDYLIEEASAEEEELLGLEPTSENQESASTVDRDEGLISVLDKIILYLRIVHSVDYYNHCEYPQEDEMPNRCGILHARGPPPTTKTDMTQFLGATVEAKMANFLPEKPKDEKDKNETKLIGLSLKDVDTEIDKFVQANTRELAKDKWLCPLSGKKFKGPDFVRKHIFNKHAEKIEEVKKEVEFFNNYLRDPKRPMLAEAPQPKREDAPPTFGGHPGYGGGGGGGGGYGGGYGRPHNFFNQGFAPRARGFPPRAARGGGDFRPVIHYRDLDAPREPEEFI